MKPDAVASLVKEAIGDAEVRVSDMTGTGDHFEIFVVSGEFRGKTLIEQHQLVQKSVAPALEDGRIHAIQIKTETPERLAKKKSTDEDLEIRGHKT